MQILLRAFKTYVPLVIEYASSIWSPHPIVDTRKAERVQRKFTKRLKFQDVVKSWPISQLKSG